MNVVQQAPAAPVRALPAGAEQRFVLHDVSWAFYVAFLAELGDRSSVRGLTYDRGSLELTVPSFRHESFATLMGIFIGVLAEELDIPMRCGGSTTFKRED